MPGYDHVFSKSFEKKVKKMFWSEKYFGRRLHLGYTLRRAAVIAVIIAGLFSVNQVSAHVFGFNPWNTIMSYIHENRMETKDYKNLTENDAAQTAQKKAKLKSPVTLPEGFKQVLYKEDGEAGMLYAEWQKDKACVQYLRMDLDPNTSISTDAEYDSKENVSISGYAGQLCVKGSEIWLLWDDEDFRYEIDAKGMKNSKAILLKMAKEIYQ